MCEFDAKPLSNHELRLFETAGSGNCVQVHLLTDKQAMENIFNFVVQGNTAQMRDPAFVRELKDWIRFNGAQATDCLFVAAISLASMAWAMSRGVDYWQTIVFTVLTLSQLFHSMAVRGETASLLQIGVFKNLPMLGAVTLIFLLQMAVIYLPSFNVIFHTQALPMFDLAVCIALSSLVLVAVELEKWLVRVG
jgi:magnesium-transporting ATPase (P-type)